MNNVLINHESSVINQQRREFERNEQKIDKLLELVQVFDVNVEEL
jgi:hypothetical protein